MTRKLAKKTICTLCAEQAERFEITGTKTLSNNKTATYQLCKECCKKLHGFSLYSSLELKKRRDFWENVWSNLA